MSSQMSTLPPRHRLTARQVETVEALVAAGRAVLDEVGHERLTIRMVAARAGVSSATAYTYFASKDHLFAELFWQTLGADPLAPLTSTSATERLQRTVRHLATVIAQSPGLAAAVTRSLLGTDPEVGRLRMAIGGLFYDSFKNALGDQADPALTRAVVFAFNGALLQSGMGLLTYERIAAQLEAVVAVLMKGTG